MAGGSKAAVYAAITANSVVMVAKFAGFALTGSGAMLAEAIHSLADVGNQSLLAIGMKRAAAPPDESHPYGYGRDAFIWSLISAVGIFFIGCGVTIAHGVHTLLADGHEVSDPTIGIGILLFSAVIEGISLGIALRGMLSDAKRRNKGFVEYAKTTEDPFGVAVLLEDFAAVLGVLIALAAIGLAQLTHEAYWDGIGSIAVGVLLGFVALFLITKNRSMLIGMAVTEKKQAAIVAAIEASAAVKQVVKNKAEFTGADHFRMSADIDFDGAVLARRWLAERDLGELHHRLDSPEKLEAFLAEFGEAMTELVGDEVDALKLRIRETAPGAMNIELEVD